MKFSLLNFIVMFTNGIGLGDSVYKNVACGVEGACSCIGAALLCKTDFFTLPTFPNTTSVIVLSSRNLSVLSASFFKSNMTSLHLDGNFLAAVPPAPFQLLMLIDISLQVIPPFSVLVNLFLS